MFDFESELLEQIVELAQLLKKIEYNQAED